jgi:uncharacterized delta-60 repeat protein
MSRRNQLEKANTIKIQYADLWRYARQVLALAVVAVMISCSLLVEVQAVPGSLDMTFSGDGKLTTNFIDIDHANAIAIQADGKIVVAGSAYSFPTQDDFALARYNSDGTLDTTFSSDGKLTTEFSNRKRESAHAVAIQADGKIVLAGSARLSGTNYDFALARYNSDGTLDTTFSLDGKLTTDFGSTKEGAVAVAIQPNGRIVVAGTTYNNTSNANFALARYTTNGALDTTFSLDGKLTTDFGTNRDILTDIALQANGKIVAVGSIPAAPRLPTNFALARYNGDGALDTTFSGDGKQSTDFFGSVDRAEGVAIQADGKIVVAGYTHAFQSNTRDFALARYNGNGSLDDGTANDSTPADEFGTNGRVNTNFFGKHDTAYDVAIQSDGKIVAAGSATFFNFRNIDFAVARYNSNGMIDTTFSEDGRATTGFAFNASDEEVQAVAIQADGKIVVAGTLDKKVAPFDNDFALARYLGN